MVFSYIVLGMLSGFVGGLLGIGGGIVTVPALYYLLSYQGVPQEHLMQIAVSTSLASTCLTSLGATLMHLRRKAILGSVIRLLFPGLIVGCALGSAMAYYLPTESLRTVFGLAALLLGPYFFFPRLPSLKIAAAPNRSLSFIAVTVGAVSSLLGLGGGIFTFPILLGYQVPLKNAVGTSSGSTLITAFLGSLYFLLISWTTQTITHLPMAHFGYINVYALLAIGLSSFCVAPIGARFSLVLPTSHMKRIFGCALAITGCVMLFVD